MIVSGGVYLKDHFKIMESDCIIKREDDLLEE